MDGWMAGGDWGCLFSSYFLEAKGSEANRIDLALLGARFVLVVATLVGG